MRDFIVLFLMVFLCAPVSVLALDSKVDSLNTDAQENDFPQMEFDTDAKSGRRIENLFPEGWLFGGSVTQKAHYAVRDQLSDYGFSRDEAGLAELRLGLRLRLEGEISPRVNFGVGINSFYDFTYERDDKQVSSEEFDAMANELELRDAFVQIELWKNVWLKTGRQIVAWGESDFAQVVDLVNPRDERDLGLQDLEDARLPIMASRLTYVGNRWGVDVVATHEFEPNRYAGKGADFDPLISLQNVYPQRRSEEPNIKLDNSGVLGRFFYSHAKGDISFIGGRVYSRQPVPIGSSSVADEMILRYPKIGVLGAALNFIEGYWLIKLELAAKSGQEFLSVDADSGQLFAVEKPLYELLAGFEYSPFQDLQLTSEVLSSVIDGHDSNLLNKRMESTLSSRLNIEFLRDTANLELVWLEWLGGAEGRSYRIAFEYDISDTLKANIGFIDYVSSDNSSMLFPFRNNDRLFSGITFSF